MTRRHHSQDRDPDLQALYTRRRFLVASAVAAVPLGAWWTLGRPGEASTSSVQSDPGEKLVDPPPATPPTTGSDPGSTPIPNASTPVAGDTAFAALDHDLFEGMVDPKVGSLQQRLTDLGFDPGPVDDYFGEATVRSVWAFDKLVIGTDREQVTGTVTPQLWDRLHGPVNVAPRRSPGGTHLEVYLPEQVAALFINGQVRLITHVSSGAGVEWCDEVTIDEDDGTQTTKGICGLSITPGGVYHFERKVDGWRNAKLGRLYKPIYFNYGIAVHGATKVPIYPASRGCVRFPMHIAEYFQDLVEIGDSVYVFDGVKDPEQYGAQPMRFDWPDPDYTTTTSTTSTTSTTVPRPAPTTTTRPPTTAAPTTTSSTTTTTTTGTEAG